MKGLRLLRYLLATSAPMRRERAQPGNPAAPGDASLREVAARVQAALAGDPDLTACAIDVEVSGGVVELSGYAHSECQAQRADDIASAMPGVGRIRNRIALAWW